MYKRQGKYKPFPSVQCTSVGSKNAGKVRASKFLLVDDMIGGIEAVSYTHLDVYKRQLYASVRIRLV